MLGLPQVNYYILANETKHEHSVRVTKEYIARNKQIFKLLQTFIQDNNINVVLNKKVLNESICLFIEDTRALKDKERKSIEDFLKKYGAIAEFINERNALVVC